MSSYGGAGVLEVISLEIRGEDAWTSKEKTGLEIQGEDQERERTTLTNLLRKGSEYPGFASLEVCVSTPYGALVVLIPVFSLLLCVPD